jgi:predicted permease
MWNPLTLLRRRRRSSADFAREITEHIALEAERLVAEGWSLAAAANEARRRFGNVGAAQERFHDARGLAFYDEARSNLLFAWRGIRHRPLQAIIVVVTLTLGIGISAGAFSTFDVIAFRPRVDASPVTFARVFLAYGTDSTPPDVPAAARVSDYLWFRDHVHSLRALAGWQAVSTTVDGRAAATHGMLVTCEFFDVYAPVRPLAGRVLQASDCASRDNVVVISHTLWRDVLSSAPDVVGRVLHINGRPLRVVGVAPPFSGPVNDANFWTPYTMRGYLQLGDDDPASPTALRLTLDGRLREGYSRSDARAELAVLVTQQDVLHHGRRSSVLVTDGSMLTQPGNGIAILTIVALVFLALACLATVVCANVTSLLLAVAHTRRVEMALRMALGSGSARLARMLLTETLALAAIAGGLATVVASRSPAYLLRWITQRELTYPTHPNWHVFAFLFVTTLCASLLVGSAPIRAALALDLVAALRGLTKDSRDGHRRSSNALMGVQIGAAVTLLIAAVSLARMSARVAASPAHLDTRRVLALNVVPPDRVTGAWSAYHEDVARTAAAVPGVEIVAFGSAAPIYDARAGVIVVTAAGTGKHALPAVQVSSRYFDVFGLHLIRGRLLATADDNCVAAVCPVVVSLETVHELWPHEDPLGKHVRVDPAGELEIVGVVSDAPSDIAARVEALMVYQSWRPSQRSYQAFARFGGDAATASHALAAAIADHFPGSVAAPETLQAFLDRFTDVFYRMGLAVGGVALVAATLALVGVYGVVSLSAKRRMKEMGIRIALGARDADVYRAMLRSNAPPVLIGLGVGVAAAVGLTIIIDRLTAATLPIPFADPFAFWGAPPALGVVVLLAIAAPARRATGAAPVEALRQD